MKFLDKFDIQVIKFDFDERAFALIHGHLIDVASLPNRRGDEVFLCPFPPLPVDIKPAFSGAGSKRGQTPGESVQGGAK